jgi:hypothetical protein
VGFADPLPDFTECSFASRENAQEWQVVVHYGGPVRAFSRRMPAFGAAMTAAQIERVVAYARSLCADRSWPRGELNLPRPIATEKAFPEDETIVTAAAVLSRGARALTSGLVYERRFAARNQWELVVPVVTRERPAADGGGLAAPRLGDVEVGVKRALYHDGDGGRIVSLAAAVSLPTGNESLGNGTGPVVVEPMVLAGMTLPVNGFLQVQAGLELPASRRRADREVFWRATLGSQLGAPQGRAWSPMVEVLWGRPLGRGSTAEWDIIPQVQVTLSRRQHLALNAGWRLPLTERESRGRELVAYLLWDWFDGRLLDGWR